MSRFIEADVIAEYSGEYMGRMTLNLDSILYAIPYDSNTTRVLLQGGTKLTLDVPFKEIKELIIGE